MGTSNYSCSIEHSPGKQAGSSSQLENQKKEKVKKKKKKSPSEKKRDALRAANFLENKRNSKPVASTFSPTIVSLDYSVVSDVPFSEEILSEENEETLEPKSSCEKRSLDSDPENTMEVDETLTPVMKPFVMENSDKSNVDQPTLERRIPVIIARNENPVIVNELTHNPDSEMLSKNQYLPPVISPISTPSPRKSQTLPKNSNQTPTPKIKEVVLILCAKNQATAVKYGKKFPKSSFLKPNDYYKTNHFEFSAKLNESNLSKINEIVKLPKKVQLHAFKVVSENMWYFFSDEQELIPVNEEPTYCPECQECASL